MPSPIILPVPLSWTGLSPGQLLVDPLNPSSTFSSPTSSAPLNDPLVQFNYTDDLIQDADGRLISSRANRTPSPHHGDPESVVHLQADRSQYNSLQSPAAAFNALCRDSSSQDYFRKAAKEGQQLYYVTAVQTLTNPCFKKTTSHSPIPNPPHDSTKLSSHERRDSALDVEEPSSSAILGVELRKVRCIVGSPLDPHSLEDIDYNWTYQRLGEDMQLSIGLGKALQAAEFRRLASIVAEEDFSDGGYDEEEDGYGGF